MPDPGSRWSRSALAAALLTALAGFFLYSGTAANDFVFDDINIAARNPIAHDPADLGRIFGSHYWASVLDKGNLYRPVTTWTFAVNHALTGEGAAGYHLTNALLHGMVSALVVLLATALGLGGGGALAAGLLFAFHPVHVEAVAPVVGRSELLAVLFVLAAWLCHLAATDRSAQRGRAAVLRAAALLFGAGLMSKEHAVVLPVLILAGDLVMRRNREGWRGSLVTLVWMAPVGIAVLVARSAVVPGLPPDDPLGSVFGGVDPFTRILTATGVLGRYLWLLVYPVTLSADYSYHQISLITSPSSALFLASALAHAGLLGAGLFLAARRRLSGLSLLIYLFALFPVSNLPVSIGTVMGERLLYLPSVGLCLLFPALFAERLAEQRGGRGWPVLRRGAAVILLLLCALYGARVLLRNRDWKDQHTLFTATVRTSPLSAKAHYNLGVAEDDRGNVQAALTAYRRAVQIKPDMTQARRNYGLDLLQTGEAGEALEHLREAARLDPEIPDVFSDLGIALHQLGRHGEAGRAFQEEIRRRPGGARAHYNLGTVFLELGRPAEAVEPLTRAAALAPEDTDALVQLGLAFSKQGRYAEALAALERALVLDPGLTGAILDLARAAEAAGDGDVGRRARALGGGSR
jgi:tetratricopeptide (TPR) repeat protein